MQSRANQILTQLLNEMGGEAAGSLELASTPVLKAREYATNMFRKYGRDFASELPNFNGDYLIAQAKTRRTGTTQRVDMPVIDTSQVRLLQHRLVNGFIDVSAPWAPDHKLANPFPEGLSGEQAKKWLQDGLPKFDGSSTDDRVKCSIKSIRVGDLVPIQKQIYVSKAVDAIAKFGVAGTTSFMSSTIFIVSSDLRLIDGHHRFLSCVLINPDMKVKCFVIDLPIKTLLPLTKAYGDAIGNTRNA